MCNRTKQHPDDEALSGYVLKYTAETREDVTKVA